MITRKKLVDLLCSNNIAWACPDVECDGICETCADALLEEYENRARQKFCDTCNYVANSPIEEPCNECERCNKHSDYKSMKRIDKLKQMDSSELARWICREILDDNCELCPFENECSWHKNPIAKYLEEEVRVI